QRTMWSLVPWAKAGARRAARMPSRPARAGTAAAPARKRRRDTKDRERAGTWLESRMGTLLERKSGRLGLVDLLQLPVRPLHRVLGSHALDALREHVDDDVLREGLGGLAAGRAGMPDLPRVLQGFGKHRGLRVLAPERVVLVQARAGNAEGVHGLEVGIEPRPVHVVADKVLGELLFLAVLHHAAVPGGKPVKAPRGSRRIVPVIGPLVDVGELLPRRHVDAGGVAGEGDLAGEEGAVVVAIVPGKAALVEALLPQDVVPLHR